MRRIQIHRKHQRPSEYRRELESLRSDPRDQDVVRAKALKKRTTEKKETP